MHGGAEPVRVVLVGCGNMARRWIDVAMEAESIDPVGLVDLDRQQAVACASAQGLSESLVYDDLEAALRQAEPEAVFDVTVPSAHFTVTLQALKAGCHVLGEKPMAESLDQARQMVATARDMQRLYAVMQNRRANPHAIGAAHFLQRGELGRVEEIHCDFYLGPHFGGFRDEMAHPLLVDMAIHTFDTARQLSGADPVNVYCLAFNPPRSWYKGDASAVAVFQMRGPEGEPIVFSYRGSWCAEGQSTDWNASWRVVGSRGTLLWNGQDQPHAQRVIPDAEAHHQPTEDVAISPAELDHTGHAHLIRDFVDCLRHGGQPMCPCEDNIKSLAMVLAAVESAEKGERVDVTL